MTAVDETDDAPSGVPGMSVAQLRQRVDSMSWYHSIDLGHGIVTEGMSELALPASKFPDLAGRSVLDIGAWDGYYAFLAERQGAARVVALDHYAWGVNLPARGRYWDECAEAGVLPDHDKDLSEFWLPDLPGRAGFDLAKAALHSAVEPVVGDFTTMDLESLGTFDVVLYLGVLYHMKEPLTCLERLRKVTGDVAVIETEAVHYAGLEGQRLVQFHAASDVGADFGNWYIPTMGALLGWARAAGFRRVEVVNGPPIANAPDGSRPALGTALAYRALVHAYV